jgi:hypothetical protein
MSNVNKINRDSEKQPKVKSIKGAQPWARTKKLSTDKRSPYQGR